MTYCLFQILFCVSWPVTVSSISPWCCIPLACQPNQQRQRRQQHQTDDFSAKQTPTVQGVLVISGASALVLAGFGGFHVHLATTNQTSLECVEHSFCPLHDGRPRAYDRGIVQNLAMLFGVHRQYGFSRWLRLGLPLKIQRRSICAQGKGNDRGKTGRCSSSSSSSLTEGARGGINTRTDTDTDTDTATGRSTSRVSDRQAATGGGEERRLLVTV